MFNDDGVFEAPLVPDDHMLPHPLAGSEAIRAGIGAYHRNSAHQGTVHVERSPLRHSPHSRSNVFIAEIDTVLDDVDRQSRTMSLVQIFRPREGQIALVRATS
jgi:hypothetical protein